MAHATEGVEFGHVYAMLVFDLPLKMLLRCNQVFSEELSLWRPRSGGTPVVWVSYSDHYAEKGLWQWLMDRLRSVAEQNHAFSPVIAEALRL